MTKCKLLCQWILLLGLLHARTAVVEVLCAEPRHPCDYHFHLKDKVLQEEEQDRGKDKKGESPRLLIVANTYTLHIETLPLQNICVQNLNEIMKQS